MSLEKKKRDPDSIWVRDIPHFLLKVCEKEGPDEKDEKSETFAFREDIIKTSSFFQTYMETFQDMIEDTCIRIYESIQTVKDLYKIIETGLLGVSEDGLKLMMKWDICPDQFQLRFEDARFLPLDSKDARKFFEIPLYKSMFHAGAYFGSKIRFIELLTLTDIHRTFYLSDSTIGYLVKLSRSESFAKFCDEYKKERDIIKSRYSSSDRGRGRGRARRSYY